jgi:hypothetical protein
MVEARNLKFTYNSIQINKEIEKLNSMSGKKNEGIPKDTSFATRDTPLPSDEERSDQG